MFDICGLYTDGSKGEKGVNLNIDIFTMQGMTET